MYNVLIKGDVSEKTLKLVENAIKQPDNDVMLTIDSVGGSLCAGMLAYDKIRESGKNFHANVVGTCMSSATLLLVACPLANRTASAHSTILIHNPLANVGYSSLNDVKNMLGTMEDAKAKLVQIYAERTLMQAKEVSDLMDSERELYATDCVAKGLIARTNELFNKVNTYNKKTNKNRIMRKSFIETLTNKLVKALLKNEVFQTVDGQEIDIETLEIGAPANCADGVYTLADNTVVTVENGVVADVIAPEPAVEEPAVVENEGEEPADEPAPAEPEKVAEEVAKEVETAVEEEDVTDATEIAQIVKEQVEQAIPELKELQELVEKCGGKDKLKALANVKHQNKVFNQVSAKSQKRSIAELMALKKK